MLPFALTALIHGPLSDALGRRPVIIVGIRSTRLASIACAFAPSFEVLLALRAVQGMSAGIGLVVGRAIVRDLHEGPQAQRLMSAITMIFSIAPAIAPVIGGWIHVALGWRSVFGFMAAIGVALVIASWVRLPETHPPPHRVPFSARQLIATAWRIAADRQFLMLALSAGANFVDHHSFHRRRARGGARPLAAERNPVCAPVRAHHRRIHRPARGSREGWRDASPLPNSS